jgi:hypothetical protein
MIDKERFFAIIDVKIFYVLKERFRSFIKNNIKG